MGNTHPECEGLGKGRCMHKYPHDGGGGRAGSPRSGGGGGGGCLLLIVAFAAVLSGAGWACLA